MLGISKEEKTGEMKKITVVIPNYNGKTYLPACLQALENQEPETPDFTVVVVDNGSTDGSVEWLNAKSCSGTAIDIRSIYLDTNTGFDYAVNVGIKSAQTPYVILLNNDTKVYPGFVKNLYYAIEKEEDIFSVSACMLMWDRPDLLDDAGDFYCVLGWAYARGKGKSTTLYNKSSDVFSACAGAAIYRKAVFDEIGLFDEAHFAYLEDLDIGYRARIHGYRNRYEPEAKVLHYGSASTGSQYNEKKTVMAAANSIYVVWKNMPVLQLIWNLPFLLLGFGVKFLFFCRKGMGKIYLKGLGIGFKRCFVPENRNKKVRFRFHNLKNYLKIQWELYVGLFLKFS